MGYRRGAFGYVHQDRIVYEEISMSNRVHDFSILSIEVLYAHANIRFVNAKLQNKALDRFWSKTSSPQSPQCWKSRIIPPTVKSLSLIHISEPTRLLSISYAVFCLKKKKKQHKKKTAKRSYTKKKKTKKKKT